jgi:plasmid stability protein
MREIRIQVDDELLKQAKVRAILEDREPYDAIRDIFRKALVEYVKPSPKQQKSR